MNSLHFVKTSALALACLGVAVPQQIFAAGPQTTHVAGNMQITDIALSSGTLNGKVVNGEGQLQADSLVKVRQGSREIASTHTTETGQFSIHNLTSGVYQITAGKAQGTVRVWDSHLAPPAAKNDILLVSGELTARGQSWIRSYSPRTLIISSLVVATAIAVPIALNNNDDDDTPASP